MAERTALVLLMSSEPVVRHEIFPAPFSGAEPVAKVDAILASSNSAPDKP